MEIMLRSFTYTLLLTGIVFFLDACTKTDVPVESELTPQNFPTTDQQYLQASGPAYTSLRGSYCQSYWQAQSLSTDEAIILSRAGGWYDGGRYQQMHLHNWTPDNPIVNDTWNWGFGTISTCNQILSLFASSQSSPAKAQIVAEIRTVRAMMLFFMMDLYGNIPVPATFGDSALPVQQNRQQV